MTGLAFMRIRLIRLMPLILLGTLLSAGYLFARMVVLHDRSVGAVWHDLVWAMLLGMACLPMFGASRAIGGPQVFPLNGPQYTLFLELVVNLFWGYARRIDTLWFAVCVMFVCYPLMAIYGMAGDETQTFWTGLPRVFGAFYAGIVVFHVRGRIRGVSPTAWQTVFVCMLGLAAITFYWPSRTSIGTGILWSAIISPLIVLSGTHVVLRGAAHTTALRLGELSYPLYVLHYPIFVWINAAYQHFLHRRDFVGEALVIVPVAVITSWLALKIGDEPVRNRINQIFRRRRAAIA